MTRLSVYDPFADVFPELFRGFFQPVARGAESGGLEIRLDVKETEGQYEVQAEMPGVKKEDIQVQIDGNRVSIGAEVKRESEKKEGERILRSERYYGSIGRTFQLASEIDEAAATAKFEDGVLKLTLPKKAVPTSKRLQIS
ncbi:MAG TPA: Hsp20/alpha crystallin family protein [Zeimonas sp.]|nr:Hsp20/alpha crystallin family protein [Zeimonas sp.]